MKLLSMKTERGDLAGIITGEEVLDVTGFCEIIEARGEWVEADADSPTYHHIEGAYRSALDLFKHGPDWPRKIIAKLEGDPILINQCREDGVLVPLARAELNPPVLAPGKILAVGLNYAAHAAEQKGQPPESPLIFSKCTTAIVGPGDAIRLPRISDKIDYEGELAVVIGKEARSVAAASAYDFVAGYTILNDVTARDLQRRERQWARAKGLDTFAPCGPWLVTKDEVGDPHSLDLELKVNGEVRQRSTTSDLIFKIPQLIEFISQDLTLRPGDIISTGTPSGVGVYSEPPVFLREGDVVEITISKIGTLVNPVVGNES
ncbi:MAG TPA: fumarylacetoacetate hydrolase family protein [Blastocatellia bacterium]|nr:fumarylacetoacetate hydrolase family protein [Blastocatellia bacterium]